MNDTATTEETTTESEADSKSLPFMLGTKQGMTQIFLEDGAVCPVTVVEAGPLTVLQVKTLEKDDYSAVQVGYGSQKEKNLSKAQRGHMGDNGSFRYVREYRLKNDEESDFAVGDTINLAGFTPDMVVDVSAISKGKGFQGVVKRHGFAGGPRTHGNKHGERSPGSIGATGPQRVLKGTRMAGRMGGERTTVKNLEIKHVDAEDNLLYVKGAVPGTKGSLVEIRGTNR